MYIYICTGGLQHDLGGEVGALHFEHALGENEVLLPEGHHVALEPAPGGAEVVQSGNASVDLERWHHEHTPDDHVVHGCDMYHKS